jgi:hypothetical protein
MRLRPPLPNLRLRLPVRVLPAPKLLWFCYRGF